MANYALPQVGDIITVATYYNSNVIGRTVEDDTTVYENVQVCKPFSWTKPGAFCIPAEGEPYINVRTISLKSVTDLVVHEGAEPGDITQGTHFVQVPGSKSNEYTVTVIDGFGVDCECLGFKYRGQCKHLKIASEVTS